MYLTDQFFAHGCLYDLEIEILPVDGSDIVHVFQEQTFPTCVSRFIFQDRVLIVQVPFTPDPAFCSWRKFN